jgi:hypothetical protein
MGARSGFTILSKNTLRGWNGSIKNDSKTSTTIIAINIRKMKFIIVAIKVIIIFPVGLSNFV